MQGRLKHQVNEVLTTMGEVRQILAAILTLQDPSHKTKAMALLQQALVQADEIGAPPPPEPEEEAEEKTENSE